MKQTKFGSRLDESLPLRADELDFVFLKGASHILLSSKVSFFPFTSFSTVLMSLCIPVRCLMSAGMAHIFALGFSSGFPF